MIKYDNTYVEMATFSGDYSKNRKTKLIENSEVVKRQTRNSQGLVWERENLKRQRIAGLEYISVNGKVVPPKQPGPDCKCRRKCFENVPENVRLQTFQSFYSMKTHEEQNVYLLGLIKQADVKRKRVKSSSKRTCTFEYFVRVEGKEIQVCQTAFKNIHAIKERKIRVLCDKMDYGLMFRSENCRKNNHRRLGEDCLPANVIDQIKKHIYSIVHTHRLKDFIRLDKNSGLEINISKMWKDYIKTYDPDNVVASTPKSKQHIGLDLQNKKNQQAKLLPQEKIQEETKDSNTAVEYPGSGHLDDAVEKYYENADQTDVDSKAYPAYIYPTQNKSLDQSKTQTTFIVEIKLEPQDDDQLAITDTLYSEEDEIHDNSEENGKKFKTETEKRPLVKLKRYTYIFHSEINSAVLTAIKTRIDSYYAESNSARKKVK